MNKAIEYNVIGKIVDVPATTNEAGEQLSPPIYRDGWHVNVIELLPEFEAFQVFPEGPFRVYAGAITITIFLRFDNEDQWLTTLAQITA